MYCDYPSVSEADRVSRESLLDASSIRVSPSQAYARLSGHGRPDEARLASFDGRPMYRFRSGDTEGMVYADDGELQGKVSEEMARRIASAWTALPGASAGAELVSEPDQWTVSGAFVSLRPLIKFSWPTGEQVYVSPMTGEVVQYTTRASRLGAYFGAIPHWLYFTPLRKHARAWSRFLIWLSGTGTIATIIGISVGIWMYSRTKPYAYGTKPSSIPYNGIKRWHMILGLSFGVIAGTWVFSGMLSMDPFPALQGTLDENGERMNVALRGGPVALDSFTDKLPRAAVEELSPATAVKELEMTSFDGEPIYLATTAQNETRIVPIHGQPKTELEFNRIADAVRTASRPAVLASVRLVTKYEAYYLDRRHRLPLPVIFAQLGDDRSSMYYIDPKTGRIVKSYDSHSRWNRWLYHGLHSLDLPWLYEHRGLWETLMLILLAGGVVLSFTALILATRVVYRTFR